MNIKKTLFKIMVLAFATSNMCAQPSGIYDGGDGQGYSKEEITTAIDHLYSGSDGEGYAYEFLLSNQDYINLGGIADGYSVSLDSSADDMFYLGGDDDGYASDKEITDNDYLHLGGNDDGYVSILFRAPFIWTGSSGTGWNVATNWNYNIIPDISRAVIIPFDVPNYPYVNSGLMSIGLDPNQGDYLCASLWIQENALLVNRVNNRVENYGEVIIDGEMWVRKVTADAFINYPSGMVVVKGAGVFTIKP